MSLGDIDDGQVAEAIPVERVVGIVELLLKDGLGLEVE